MYNPPSIYIFPLEQSVDLTGLGVNVHIQISWGGRKAGDGLDIGGQGVTRRVVSKGARRHVGMKLTDIQHQRPI